jgi:hypothetical protein
VFDLLQIVTQKLAAIKVPYMLSGSVAMSFYSVSRTTRDIDIVAYLRLEDLDNLLSAFEGYYFHRESVKEEIDRKGLFNIISNENGFKIDFIVLKTDEYSQTAFNRRRLRDFIGIEAEVISIEDLILAKLKWIQQLYSERQFEDIENLLKCDPIDKDYLIYWKEKLNLNTFDLF